MSYLALYRKYRPQKFDDVIGQEHIVKTLQNQINSGRIAHAYLFTGSRGTGKTTVAKIFARAVNSSTTDFSLNIIEIDAASHNGVDNIREINEEVLYLPAYGKYKIYIIDEVHMLSSGAFNAMLKTLEEPPSHVIFILATTDPQKIPVTILSRCQRYDFRRISSDIIEKCLEKYMQIENVNIDTEALGYIARLADGGMRDALSILEQCISFYFDEHITMDKVLYLVGSVDNELLFKLMDVIRVGDATTAINICNDINNQGRSIRQFTKDILVHNRNLLIAHTTEGKILDYSQEHISKLMVQAKQFDVQSIVRYINIFSELDAQIRASSIPKVILEVAILKLCTPSCDLSPHAFHDKIIALETKLEQVERSGIRVVEPEKKVVPTKLPVAVPEDIHNLADNWNDILGKLDIATRASLYSVQAGVLEDDILYIVHSEGMKPVVESKLDMLKEIICAFAQKQVRIVAISNIEYANKRLEIFGSDPLTTNREAMSSKETLEQIQVKINYEVTVI
ncbi:MAG: DNA polymerase III, subunit gamma and tau [Epulopiscium sp. Nuni2H_MBin001]|nr:MAG: DNA polymerase III, subunit gamma and tau [Epulopiscium sp. Nuni2H_MBin001]